MASCTEMKVGEVYVCKDCGLELKVVKECQEPSKCTPCNFICCNEAMVKKG